MPEPDTDRPSALEPAAERPEGAGEARARLTAHVLRSVLVIYLAVAAAAGGLAWWLRWQQEARAIRESLQGLQQAFDEPLRRGLWQHDELQLKAAVETIAHMPEVWSVELRDGRGERVWQAQGRARLGGLASRLPPWPVTVTAPIRPDRGAAAPPAGTLRIATDDRLIVDRLGPGFVVASALTMGKAAALALLLAWILHTRLARPLAELARQASTWHPGRAPLRPIEPPARADDELHAIVAAINHLLATADQALASESALAAGLARQVEQLELARRSLVESEKMAALGSLVAGVAHEINTPVGLGLTGASHIHYLVGRLADRHRQGCLSDEDLRSFIADATELSRSISHSLERAARLVRSFNLVAVDQSLDEFRHFQPRAYIQDLLLTHTPMLRVAGVSARVEARADLTVYSDPGAWAQLLSNLIANAVVHGFADRPEAAWILIEVEELPDRFLLSVSDNGAGMRPEVARRIFEPFFTTNRSRGGSGLGMHIVYNLVTQRLAGDILVDSAPGQGTVVHITLPRVLPPVAEATAARPRAARADVFWSPS